jgi:hypothetical protein
MAGLLNGCVSSQQKRELTYDQLGFFHVSDT